MKTDRIAALRNAFPELSESQARFLLCACWEVAWDTNPNMTKKEVSTIMDKSVEGLCNSTTQKIGELLDLIPEGVA
jgi:hypothetical protein